MSLWEQFLTHEGRGVQKWTQYIPVYERHVARFQNRSITMLEIGVNRGGSLQMWKRYLGPYATIVGVDIAEKCKEFEEDQIYVRIGSQADTAFLDEICEEFGPFDVILDDGSHINDHQVVTIEHLYNRLTPEGVYLVEDTHTSYVERYGGGLRAPGTFIEYCKNKIDALNGYNYSGGVDQFTKNTISIHVYDSIVVFERGRHRRSTSVDRGEPRLAVKPKL
ncbi:class I SAM-dependent methyltransferase [Chenggangzhangella methanolivorans]